ncbi:MAG: DUF2184 domain-containing protein [Allorhizobium sp.]
MNQHIDFTDAQNALGFIMPAFYNVERTVYQTKYQAFDYSRLLPVITEGNEWGRGVLFRSSDIAGKAEWISGKGFDMPYADVSQTQYLKGFEMAGIGYEWSLEEIQVAALEGRSLGNEKAMAAKKVAERKLWGIGIEGDTEKGWTGLINDANVTAADVAANGTGSTTWWANKTGDQIVDDINAGIETIYTQTKGTELANTLALPSSVMGTLGKRMPDTNETTLSFLQRTNRYTARTGQPLLITEMFELNTADAGGDGRAVLYARNPDVVRFHLPMPHRFLTPFQKSSMTWEVAGIMRTGGTEIRLPRAMLYLDGVYDATP